jgi:hypothetical protein
VFFLNENFPGCAIQTPRLHHVQADTYVDNETFFLVLLVPVAVFDADRVRSQALHGRNNR